MPTIPQLCSRFLLFCLLVLNIAVVNVSYANEIDANALTFYDPQIEPALYFQRQADLTIAPQRQDFLIHAVISHLQEADLYEARQLIDKLFAEPITVKQLSETKLLKAQIALREQQPQRALDILYTLPPYLHYDLMIMQYDLLASAYADTGEAILSLEQRLALDKKIKTPGAKQANLLRLWSTLQAMPSKQIADIHNATANPDLKAWLSVGNLHAQYRHDPATLKLAIAQWQTTYPDHPALAISQLESMLSQPSQPSTFPSRDYSDSSFAMNNVVTADGFIPIKKYTRPSIAVLLPKHGDFAAAGKIIEQGIMAHYYQMPEENRPILQFYDASQQPRQVYQHALDQGADFVIGPLTKDNITELYRAQYFPVPTLVLNDIAFQVKRRTQNTFFQFSLSNENEAYQTAIRAFQDNRANALIIHNDKTWSKKLDNAFSNHFEHMGGSIRERLALKPKTDPAPVIKSLLQFTETPQPIKDQSFMDAEAILESQLDSLDDNEIIDSDAVSDDDDEDSIEVIKIKPKFTRHRTDVDMIFMALTPAEAQRVIPLLKFYYAQDIPVYTTSVINSSPIDERLDLEGAMFCDMPWIVQDNVKASELRHTINKRWPQTYSSQPRLFAFGADALTVAMAILQQDTQLQGSGIAGHTGKLSLVGGNKIFRQLPWAQFKRGKLRSLDGANAHQ